MISLTGNKIRIAQLETKIEFLEALLSEKNTEIIRLKLAMDKDKDFWMREITSVIQNNKPAEGSTMELSDLVEPTDEENKKQVEQSEKAYADYKYWNEGSGIRYEPEGN